MKVSAPQCGRKRRSEEQEGEGRTEPKQKLQMYKNTKLQH